MNLTVGICRRGKNEEEDNEPKKEPSVDEKEWVEYATSADPGRNDTGRTSEPGSAKSDKPTEADTHLYATYTALKAIGKPKLGSIRPEVPSVRPFAGIALGVLKTRVTGTTDEPEKMKWGTHVGVAGHPLHNGNTDIRTVTWITTSKDGPVHA